MVKKYGLPMLVTSDDSLKEYIQTILAQVSGECESWSGMECSGWSPPTVPLPLHYSPPADIPAEWLLSSHLTRLVLAIKSVETDETLERWQFDIHTEDGPTTAGALPGVPKPVKKKNKTEKEVASEIQGIMKQITSSVTFLPILDEECEWQNVAEEMGVESSSAQS